MAAAALLLPLSMGQSAPTAGQSKEEFVITCSDEGVDLDAFVANIQGLTGEPFYYEPRDLKDHRLFIKGTVRIPKDKLMSFFELSLRHLDFVHLEFLEGEKRFHVLHKLGQQARGLTALKSQARVIDVSELPGLADRWTLVTTNYDCKNLPAREAVTVLTLYFADSATESIRNIEGTETIIMTGFAANLASQVAMLDRIDAAVAASPGFVPPRTLEKRLAELEKRLAALEPKGSDR
jgi:hypothetical protein